MTPQQWGRVLRAGQEAIPAQRFYDNSALTPELYPVAALRWSLTAMQDECWRIAGEVS